VWIVPRASCILSCHLSHTPISFVLYLVFDIGSAYFIRASLELELLCLRLLSAGIIDASMLVSTNSDIKQEIL
jgi:hypothetical protein